MDKTYLPDLISGLEQELLRLGYTKGSMSFYRRRWNQLMGPPPLPLIWKNMRMMP